jgi:flagellar basal body rod protein FlgC
MRLCLVTVHRKLTFGNTASHANQTGVTQPANLSSFQNTSILSKHLSNCQQSVNLQPVPQPSRYIMASLTSISLSGMSAALTQVAVAAHNVANANTPNFKRQQVSLSAQPQGGVLAEVSNSAAPSADLVTDVVSELQAKNAFMANLAVFKTQDKMAGALLDHSA